MITFTSKRPKFLSEVGLYKVRTLKGPHAYLGVGLVDSCSVPPWHSNSTTLDRICQAFLGKFFWNIFFKKLLTKFVKYGIIRNSGRLLRPRPAKTILYHTFDPMSILFFKKIKKKDFQWPVGKSFSPSQGVPCEHYHFLAMAAALSHLGRMGVVLNLLTTHLNFLRQGGIRTHDTPLWRTNGRGGESLGPS